MVKRPRAESGGGERTPAPAEAAKARPGAADLAEPSQPSSRSFVLELALCIALATLAVFSGALRAGFIVYDDPLYVTENPHVAKGLTFEGLGWFLHHSQGGNWHLLTSLSHMLDAQLFGLRPAWHHATSLCLHALAAVLLFLALKSLTGARWRSAAVALLWALHPLRVESVAWISERKDVLSGVFFMLVLLAYARWSRAPSAGRMALVVACFALGLLAKSMLVTLPGVLLLLDAWPLQERAAEGADRSWTRRVRQKWPLFALMLAAAVLTFVVQRESGAVSGLESLPLSMRAANALTSCVHYLGTTFWPARLAVFYPFHAVGFASALAAGTVLLAVSAFALLQWRRRPYLAVGWFWFLGMLLPVIGLVQVGLQSRADRYTYLPSIGLCVALVWGVAEWAQGARWRRQLAGAVWFGALAALSVASVRQVGRWKDSRTLFTWTASVTGDNAIAQHCLGEAAVEARDFETAIGHYREALRIRPNYRLAHGNLGVALGELGRLDAAIAEFKAALALEDDASTRHNLGHALARQGDLDRAIAEFETALRLDPDQLPAHLHLAAALIARGDEAGAEPHLARALELEPGNTGARRQLAELFSATDRAKSACEQYRAILASNPNDIGALGALAWILSTSSDAALRNGPEAVRLAERALAFSARPNALLEATLAAAHAESGNFPEAVSAAKRAVDVARAAGAADDASRFEAQLARYRAGQALRDGDSPR